MSHDPNPPDAAAAREREWLLQEAARQDQRDRRSGDDASARHLRYRVVARELAQPAGETLPSNFPYATALAIQQRLVQERRRARRFVIGLVVAFVALYGGVMLMALWIAGAGASLARLQAPWAGPDGWLWALLLLGAIACLPAWPRLGLFRHTRR